jgi:two-component system phosphate regulon response regulator PhoB
VGSDRTSGKRRILIVEDDPDLCDLLRYNFEGAGYQTSAVASGAAALRELETFIPDLILLDLVLDDVSGLEVCRRIRTNRRIRQPIMIVLTAKSDEIDRVVAFEVGADDYVVKPFSMRELLLRVRAHLRDKHAGEGTGTAEAPRSYEVGALKVDLERYRVSIGGKEIQLSALEMRLLAYLITARGAVCSRATLLRDVWHYKPGITTRTVDTHVKRLRDKLGQAGILIQTVRGLGYRFDDLGTARGGIV